MKRYFILLAAVGLSHTAVAQAPEPRAPTPDAPSVLSIYQTDAWRRAFANYQTPDTELTPRPETNDIQQIQAIADLIGEPSQVPAALQQLERYRNRAGTAYSPIIDQIIGSLYFQLGQNAGNEAERNRLFAQARPHLERAIERFPSYRQAHKNLANLLFLSGEQQTARNHFVRALELGDRDAITYGMLAAIYFENEQYSSAETAARSSLMLNPTIVEFRRILGMSLLQQERYNEARAVFEELLVERPNDAFYWQAIANTLINTDEIDQAAQVLEVVRFMGAAQPQTLLLLGDVYMNKNMVEDAAEAYFEALDLSSRRELPPITTFQRPIESLSNYQAYDLAARLLDEVEQVYGNRVEGQVRIDMLALRSEINMARGQTDEAARNLQDILRQDPLNPRALLTLANYFAYRDPDENLSAVEQRQFRARSVQRALDLFARAQELRYTGSDRDLEAARSAFVGEGQLQARERNFQAALSALREAQQIREEERIADYIRMIETVQGQVRR